MKKLVWFIILILFVGIAYALSSGSNTTEGVVKIGVIAPLSGDAAAYGEQVQRVLDYRLESINADGEAPQFELIYEDGKCSGADAVLAFQKLVDVDGVSLILGGTCSSETLAIAPLAEGKEVVLLSPLSSNPAIEDEASNVFSLSYSDKKTGLELARELSRAKTVAIITEQNDFNIGIRDSVLEAMAAYNTQIVSNETFPKGANDFRGVLEKVAATNPELVLLNPNPGATTENLLKQIAEMKLWTGDQLVAQFAYLSDNSRKDVGDFAEGMTIIDAPTVTGEEFSMLVSEIEEEKGTLSDIGSYYIASTLDAIDILTNLVRKHGADAAKIQEELATGSFTGFIGPIEFNGNNFVQLNISGKYIVEDGTAVLQ